MVEDTLDRTPDRFDKFTERSRRVLKIAQEATVRLNHPQITPDHFALGLLSDVDSLAAQVLRGLGVDLHTAYSTVEQAILPGTEPVEKPGLSERSKKVIELAVDETGKMNHPYIGTEHLLLGILRESRYRKDKSEFVKILGDLKVNPRKVRIKTVQLLTPPPPRPDTRVVAK